MNNTEIEERGHDNLNRKLMLLVAIILSGFHIYTASFGILPGYAQSSIHWTLVGTFIILIKPLKHKLGKFIDVLIILFLFYGTYHQIKLQEMMIYSAGIFSKQDIIVSIISIVIALEIARRLIGNILPGLAILFLVYALFGNKLIGILKTTRLSINRVAPYLFTSSDGLFGQTLLVSAQFIFLFVLFGSILNLTGAGEFFVNMAFSLTGRSKGGPAQAAIYSSMLMGTINGSGAANVVTTGTFTIPLMKKVGFRPSTSGAIEAVASSGGQIMPPVMGAVAFLMSELTGIEYAKIAKAALVPAMLYYFTLSMSVFILSRKHNIEPVPEEQMTNFKETIKKGWLYFSPLITLVYLLATGYSAQKSALGGIIVSLVVGIILNRENMTLKNLIDALYDGAMGIAPIAAACILAGVIMGVINLTGLGLKISGILEMLAGGRLLLGLVLAMLTSLVLGMGLPTSAAYMILAVLVAPAIINMGASMMSAHLFILYYGALSTITPPVALSTFAAAGIAGADIWETGVDAMKLAAAGFIIPFIFVYSPELLLDGTFWGIVISLITALLGCTIIAISLSGWFLKNLTRLSRILLFPAGIMLIVSNPLIINIVGLIFASVILLFENKALFKNKGSIF